MRWIQVSLAVSLFWAATGCGGMMPWSDAVGHAGGGVDDFNTVFTSSTDPDAINDATKPPATDQGGRLSIVKGVLVDAQGKPFILHGVNWFGFETGATMVDGTYQAGTYPLGGDFATVVQRIRLLGFNTVRLPFSFQAMSATPKVISSTCTIPSQQDVAASVTPPGQTPPATVPAMPAPAKRTAGLCNDYVPSSSIADRLVWVVTYFAHNGLYVVLDDHLAVDNVPLQDTANWPNKWASLVAQIGKDPVAADHLLVDLLNEPDVANVKWAPSGMLPALSDLYLNAMDAITAVSPKQLFLVEGTGQLGINDNYGDGFCTDGNVIAARGLSDPRPFFRALRGKPYARQVLVSPHVYPPTVTSASTAYTGSVFFDRMSTSFGYLTTQGFCDSGTCEPFPIVLGEFGSKFTDSRDLAFMSDIASYWNNAAPGNDGRHAKLGNWIYWDWNPSSGDTGGLVDDNWNLVHWNKIQLLQQMGLTLR